MKHFIYSILIVSCLILGTSDLLAEDFASVELDTETEQLIHDNLSAANDGVTKEIYQDQYQPTWALASMVGGIYQMKNAINTNYFLDDGYITINQNGDYLVINWFNKTNGDHEYNIIFSSPLKTYQDNYGDVFLGCYLKDLNMGTYNMTGQFRYYYTKTIPVMMIILDKCYGDYCPKSNISVGKQIW